MIGSQLLGGKLHLSSAIIAWINTDQARRTPLTQPKNSYTHVRLLSIKITSGLSFVSSTMSAYKSIAV